jgi:hypothetical protein
VGVRQLPNRHSSSEELQLICKNAIFLFRKMQVTCYFGMKCDLDGCANSGEKDGLLKVSFRRRLFEFSLYNLENGLTALFSLTC